MKGNWVDESTEFSEYYVNGKLRGRVGWVPIMNKWLVSPWDKRFSNIEVSEMYFDEIDQAKQVVEDAVERSDEGE
jgi:hypothetical protein